jgi:phosphatidylglycerol:prolipoprotein diacylglycerol transferase
MLPLIKIGSVEIPTYFLVISLVFLGELFYLVKRAQIQKRDLKLALDLYIIVAVSGFMGARLVHVVFEEPAIYLLDPKQIFYFWQGGFVFYGGVIVSTISGWIYLKIIKESFFTWADFAVPIVSSGYMLGRFSCFLAGCCYGKFCDLPWAVADRAGIFRHPTQIYAMLTELVALVVLLSLEKRKFLKLGDLFLLWLCLHGLGRILMEVFRDDFRGHFIWGFSISTLISLAIVGLGLLGLLLPKLRQP